MTTEKYICAYCKKEHDGSYGSGRFCSKSCATKYAVSKVKNRICNFKRPRAEYGRWNCPHCDFIGNTRKELIDHKHEMHFQITKKGKWSKGLTKETDQRISWGKTLSKNINIGKTKPSFLGRKHSEETKKKMSLTHKKQWEGKCIWSTQIEKRKSYAEQYFESIFLDAKRNYHVDKYFLDFAWPEKKIYIEVDGEQHYKDQKVIEHDKIRTKILESLNWKCIRRIRWSTFKKLSDNEKKLFIDTLLEQIEKFNMGM